VSDPWEAFVRASEGAEAAGYFERAADGDRRTGTSVWFSGGVRRCELGPRSDLGEIAHESDRFLVRHRGGAVVGYLGYDAVGLFEPALHHFPSGSPFPLGELAFAEEIHVARTPPRRLPPRSAVRNRSSARESMPRARYIAAVRRLRRDIRNGESYQVVLANRRAWRRPPDLLQRAGTLRGSERFAYFFYLRFGDRELVGATPESVVELRGRHAVINPIAGTLPKGRPGRGRLPLRRDPKELAEHRMLVDLARNDLGRVAVPGTVSLLQREERVRYTRLEHLVSRVGAVLPKGVGPWGALAAAFPAGTVSGAPKIRATELFRREERTWRGPYAGTVGLVLPGQRADWALTIRSGFAAGNTLYTAAGAGIVYPSRPRREYQETLTKLAHVEEVLVGDPP
jgi:anthranilate/para-aminobenzoate synthase component I